VHATGLTRAATVIGERFEDVANRSEHAHTADIVTVRAVRADSELFSVAGLLLHDGGRLCLFRPAHDPSPDPPGFKRISTVPLIDSPASFLSSYRRVFHVEQSG
jgi:hypothetical protein